MNRIESDRLKTAYEDRVRTLQEALAKRGRELTVLSAVALRIQGEENPETILDIALEEILSRMELSAAWVFLGEEKDRKLHLAASRGVAASYLEEIRTHGLGECLCPEVFWTGHAMQARNTTQCPRMPMIVEGLAAPAAHACIPLKFEEQRRGVLNVAARPGEPFSEDELRFLETLGRQVSIAVERARHLHAERLRNLEARALAAINKAIGGPLDVNAVLKAVGQTAREILGADRVHIFLGSDPRQMTVAHLCGLPHPELKEGQRLDLSTLRARLQIAALEEGRLSSVDDWKADPRVNQELARRWGSAAGIVAPLAARDRRLGILVLTRATPHRWSADQVELAEALAAQASVALENARLYEEARRAYQELKNAQARIIQSEKLAAVGTFASGLAHEVRNPLNSIALQLSILERRAGQLEPPLGAQLAEIIGIIREEIERLNSLVEDFLLLSRTNRIQHRLARFDSLIDEVVRLLRPEARRAGVTLKRQRMGEPLPELRMDAEKMKQVVINLVKNAVEAMPEGGVVTVNSGLVDDSVKLVVRDSGPGLPEGLDVFQLFVTTKPKGTGLGLSIAQQVVLEHGGEITAESAPGKGAAFTVSLPVTPPERRVEGGTPS